MGLPKNSLIFFLGILLLPPLAGITAMLISVLYVLKLTLLL